MARIGPINVSVGNYTYQFVVYDLDGPFYNAAGVYIFSKGTINSQGVNEHQFLYIGETGSLQTRLTRSHEKWDRALRLGMNYISVYVPRDPNSRVAIQDYLIEHLNPPLND